MKNARFLLFLILSLFLNIAAHAQKSPLLWATYFGGDTSTWGGALAIDTSGNVYMTGYTYCNGIATKGAFQTFGDTVNGAIYLAKFSPAGKLLWATYYGFNSWGTGITIDKSGNVWIVGTVDNPSGIITTSGAYQTIFGGGASDAFIAKFSPSGSLLYSTYFGGNGEDIADNIVTDSFGYIYIAGRTTSTSEIATNGAYKTTGDSINGDAFLAKFNPSGNLIWATYYGGNHLNSTTDDLVIDNLSNLYITGYTFSTVGIATSGAFQTSGDSVNGEEYLAKFSSSGSLIWATYDGEYNGLLAVSTDIYNNVYITGNADDTGIATVGAYQTSFAGGNPFGDAFLAKFSPSGSLLWATYYGGGGDDEANNAVTDKSGNVYISGITNSIAGIATSGAYQTANAGGYDAFLAKFNSSGNLLWATYYGGSGDDYGGDIAIDISGNIYWEGLTNSASGIATLGAYQTLNISDDYDAFLVKFDIPTYTDIEAINTSQNEITLFPNPATQNINLKYTSNIPAVYTCTISDVTGRIVENEQIQARAGENISQINVQNLSPGMYIISLQNDNTVQRIKFLKD